MTVKTIGQTVQGPTGPVHGAMTLVELHMDGALEDKTFAPGYGEFNSGTPPEDFEATALAIPTDAWSGPPPAELRTLLTGAHSVYRAARLGDWAGASQTVNAMNGAWATLQGNVPPLLAPIMTGALDDLTAAVANHQSFASRQATLDVTWAGLDQLLQFRNRVEVDVARLDLWARQLELDAEAEDIPGIKSDLVILKWIVERLEGTGAEPELRRVRQSLAAVRTNTAAGNFAGVSGGGSRLQEILRERTERAIGQAR